MNYKKKIWFLTMFSLVLVLSIYYVTMPKDLMLKNIEIEETTGEVDESSNVIIAMRLDADNEYFEELEVLKNTINGDTSMEEKNQAFSRMKNLNILHGEEESVIDLIKNELNLDAYVKIHDDNIKVILNLDEHDKALANKIMRLVQSKYSDKKYITVEFK